MSATTTATEVVIKPDEEARLAEAMSEVPALVQRAGEMQVRTHAEAVEATEFLSQIAGGKKAAEEARKFIVGPLNAHVKTINERVKAEVAPLEEADGIVRGKVQAFNREQARLREEQEAEARKVAERQQREAQEQRDREEREAREAREEAERASRQAAEEAAAAEAARNADRADALEREMQDMGAIDLTTLIRAHLTDARDPLYQKAVAAKVEMDRRRQHRQAQERAREAAEAEEAARAAERQAAERLVVEPPTAEIAAPAPLRSESGSIATRKRWTATVQNPHLVPREYMLPDQKALNEAVRGGVREIPGVLIEQVDDLAVRAR